MEKFSKQAQTLTKRVILVMILADTALIVLWLWLADPHTVVNPMLASVLTTYSVFIYMLLFGGVVLWFIPRMISEMRTLEEFVQQMVSEETVTVTVRDSARKLQELFKEQQSLRCIDERNVADPKRLARLERLLRSDKVDYEALRRTAIRLGYTLPETIGECAEMQTAGEKAAVTERVK